MLSSFLEALFSISLFFFGGHILDTRLSFHHFEDSDYKDIFFLKNKQSTIKKCTKHSIFENIEKIKLESNRQDTSSSNGIFSKDQNSNNLKKLTDNQKLPLPNIKNLRKWINKDKKAS